MEKIENRRFGPGDKVQLDGNSFRNCIFQGCEIIYEGGETDWEDVHWLNCAITLEGCANRTVQVLQALGCKIVPVSGQTLQRVGA